ncbi:MAG TPA: TIGR03618 family F420-dependent PPOX class oxidoreductase [Pseudonocardiaceae bacterium]|nr:TIGR03618 family F420-dependent PPOX class oxidoreductase [Pseudonocardiaceae bacterium]
MELPEDLVSLLRQPSLCFVATTMPDGGPQVTQTWVDTDGSNIVVNTVEGVQKVRNMRRDPRVAVNIVDANQSFRYYAIRGRVLDITTDGAAEHIEELSQRYTGGPYPWYGGRDRVRLKVTIEADRIRAPR